jgi:Zn-dependent protease with chaperone function
LASEGATVALTEEDLSRGIHGVVGPIRRRGRFGLGLVLTAVATLILPLIYLAVVLATCYVVYLHLVHDTWLIETLTLWRLVAYLGPALTGGVVVFFLWKPILARPVQVESGVRVERSEAPLLFKFVDLIQAAVGAPPPSEIRIDALVNASASFRRGFWSFARRSDLTLTIGMPLLAGLTARQLGGVLGHELGHFAQGSGMRLTYLIRSINGWLVRVAYERDSWDDALAREAKQAHWSISLPLQAGQLAVLASRKLLAGLAMGGHVIGTFLQRELEMDADRYEVGVAGSDVFEATARRMRVLTVARSGALDVTTAEWREGRLPDDFSGLVVALAERIPEEIRAKIESLRPEGSIFDTHPPDERRIASAKAERAAGILTLEAPALALLGEASPLRERVSRALYQHGFVSGRGQLRPLAELLSRLDARHAQVGAAERYFGEIFDLLEPMGAPAVSPASSLAAGLEWLSEARETSLRLRGDKDRADAARVAARERLAATLALLYLPEVRARRGWTGGGTDRRNARRARRRTARHRRRDGRARRVEQSVGARRAPTGERGAGRADDGKARPAPRRPPEAGTTFEPRALPVRSRQGRAVDRRLRDARPSRRRRPRAAGSGAGARVAGPPRGAAQPRAWTAGGAGRADRAGVAIARV